MSGLDNACSTLREELMTDYSHVGAAVGGATGTFVAGAGYASAMAAIAPVTGGVSLGAAAFGTTAVAATGGVAGAGAGYGLGSKIGSMSAAWTEMQGGEAACAERLQERGYENTGPAVSAPELGG